MTDVQYADAMAELKRRREAALMGKSRAELARVDHMRTTLMWHIQHVSSGPDAWAAHNPLQCLLALIRGCSHAKFGDLVNGQQGHQRQVMPHSHATDDMQRQRRSLLGAEVSGLVIALATKKNQHTAAAPPILGLLVADGTEMSLKHTGNNCNECLPAGGE